MQGMGRGTARRAVEGQSGGGDCFRGSIDICKNLCGGNAQHCEAKSLKRYIALKIALRPVAAIMSLAIDFDDQLGFGAIEVGDVTSDRMLAAKLRPARASTKALPKQHLGQAHLLS